MPLPYRHLTSVLLRREGDLFLFDAGEGTQVSLRRLNLRWKKINTIFISHTHADHVTGLPGILMLSAQVDRDEPLYIIGPPKIKEYVEQVGKFSICISITKLSFKKFLNRALCIKPMSFKYGRSGLNIPNRVSATYLRNFRVREHLIRRLLAGLMSRADRSGQSYRQEWR